LASKVIGVSGHALCLPFVALEGGEGLAVVADVGGVAGLAGARVGEGIRAAIVGGRQAVGARLWAGVHLRTAPAGSGWRVNGAWDDIAAGGEVCLRADDAGEGRDGDQKR